MFRIIVGFSLIFIAPLHADPQLGEECFINQTCTSKSNGLYCEGPGLSGFGYGRCCTKKISPQHCILAKGDTKGTCECLHRNAKLEYPGEECFINQTCTSKSYGLYCEGPGLSGFGYGRCCTKKISPHHCILAKGDTKGTCECLHRKAKLE